MGLNLFDILGHAADGYHIAHTQHVAEAKATADHAQQLKEYQDAQQADLANKQTLLTQTQKGNLDVANAQGASRLDVANAQGQSRVTVAELKQRNPLGWARIQEQYAAQMVKTMNAYEALGRSHEDAKAMTDELFANFPSFALGGAPGAPPSPAAPSTTDQPDWSPVPEASPAAAAAPAAPVVSSPPASRPGVTPNYSAPPRMTIGQLKPTTITTTSSAQSAAPPKKVYGQSPAFIHRVANDARLSTDKGKHEKASTARTHILADAGLTKSQRSADTSIRNTDENIQGRKDIALPRLDFDKSKFERSLTAIPAKNRQAVIDKADKKNYMTTGEKLELSTLEKSLTQAQKEGNAKDLLDQPLVKPQDTDRRIKAINDRKQEIGHAIDKRHDAAVKKAKMETNGISQRKGSVTGSLAPADPRLTTKMGPSVGVRPRPKPQGMKIFPKATRNNLTPQEKKLLGAF